MLLSILFILIGCGTRQSTQVATQSGITHEVFGQHQGKDVHLYTIINDNGLIMKVSTFGGIITHLHVPDRDGKIEDVVLGFDNHAGYVSAEYIASGPYFGAIVGRYGNRIAGGKFTIDGVEYTLATNNGPNHLHGGIVGFNSVLWDAHIIENQNAIQLTYTSKDMEEGYPGNLKVKVIYTLTDDNEVKIDYLATTDKTTHVNLTNHSYFNLSAGKQATILDHVLTIYAEHYTEVDQTLIPTGNLPQVAGTPMDFRTPHRIGDRIDADFEQLTIGAGYDHNWVLNTQAGTLNMAASLYEPVSGRFMEVLTTQLGVQFYAGNFLDGTLIGKDGKPYQRRAGLCLETQFFPDSPNQPAFPSTLLNPSQTYRTITIYKFSVK
jgi:aldose 1-epimerase